MRSLRLRLLGGLDVCDTAGRAIAVPGAKATLLLAYLALRADKPHSREKLMGLLWSQRSEAQARGSLRQALWALRQALEGIEPAPLIIEGQTVTLDSAAAQVDVITFQELLADGSPESLESALALYRGKLLETISIRDPALEDFVRTERDSLHERALDACTQLLGHQIQTGMHEAAAAAAKRLLSFDPLEELAHRALMEHYAGRGQIGLAVRQYQICREALRRELDVEPDGATQSLFHRIRLARVGAGARPVPSGEKRSRGWQGADFGRGVRLATLRTPGEPDDSQPAQHIGSGAAATDDGKVDSHSHVAGRSYASATNTCPRCGDDNPAGYQFCGECGARLAINCPACNAENPGGQKFCGRCGASLPQAHAPLRFVSPNEYTPKHLAEKILTSRGALEGERKQVTVLFADLEGVGALFARHDPEQAREILDPFLVLMIEAVHRYEGTVTKIASDGIMALFGAPLAHEDHAVRACYAALEIRESIKRHAEEAACAEAISIQARTGLSSGEVVVRAIRNDLSMDYDAIGPTTHWAAQARALAAPGKIQVTQNTLRLAEGFIRVKPLEPSTRAQLSESIMLFELIGATPARTRFQTAVARGLSRFVGRDTELEALSRAVDRAVEGHGQVFAVVGDQGVGKSRLVYEFVHSQGTKNIQILESRPASYGKATPYLPVIDLLKAYFHVDDRDDARRLREKVTGKLLELDERLRTTLPAILDLLHVPPMDAAWEALEPTQRRRHTLEAVRSLILRESQVQPLVIVFEDLHWIDGETQAFLDSLVESLPTAPILLLVNYRPEYHHGWGSKMYYTQRRLGALGEANTEQLLHDLLGTDSSLVSLKALLLKRGNPFFLEETVRTLVASGSLVGERGGYCLVRPLHTLEIPPTARATLAARIDRLPTREKQILQAASAIGKDVPYAILRAITELSEDILRRGLADLQKTEFLYETRLFPHLEYTFKHTLTQEVTYGSLLAEQRRELNGRIVDAIEDLYPDRLAEHVERLAHHALRGELWERATGYLRRAGAKAAGRSAYREAAAHFEQVLAALRHLPETQDTLQQAIDVRFEVRSSLQALGEHDRVFEHLRNAERLAATLADQDRLGWASTYLSQYLWWMGDLAQAEASGQRALIIASKTGDYALQAATNFFLGQGYFNVGDYSSAIDYFRRNVASINGERTYERFGLTGLPSVLSRVWLAWSLGERGEFPEALAHAEQALAIAETADQPYSAAASCLGLGQVRVLQGAIAQAIPVLERAMGLCNTWDLRVILPMTEAVLGLAYALCGRVAEALPLLEESENRAPRIRIFDAPTAATALGAGYLSAARVEQAAEFASRAAELAADRGFRGSEGTALRLLGEIDIRREPPEVTRANRHYRRALDLARELGMRPLMAHSHLGLGGLHQRIAKRKQAREHLATALSMYRDMDMGLWAERASAMLEGLE
ncbi:MAG: AAA family ATPase [Gammaproteobacteria bacterium]|nr:AAA family ATPase [Gammaproteobacteria bacterium]